MEGGLVVSVAWAVVGILGVSFLYSILMHILKSYQRTDKLPESFPFQNTIRTALSRHTILDFILHSQNEFKDKESGCLNLYGLPWMVFTRNIDNITHVLKEIDTFGKGPLWIERFSGLLGQGIFNSDGEIWYKHRKVSANLFKLSSFKNEILDTFHAHSLELIDVLKGKQPGSQIDIQGLMFNFTLESIGKIAFGIKFNALRQKSVWFADYFDYCQAYANESFMDPFWLLRRYLTPGGWLFFWKLFWIDRFAYQIVKKRREDIAEIKKQRDARAISEVEDEADSGFRDLLSLYINKDGESASDSELRDTILNFLIAGRDTTANALSWAIFTLCTHPEQQARCSEEVHKAFLSQNPKAIGTEKLSYQDIASCKYLEAFCMEVLRLYPSVPKEGKFAFKDTVLPDGTKVEKGQLVVFAPWVMGRTEALWENCTEFRPERFLENPKPSPFVFTAFQAGPRICLGQNMALLEMKYVLSYLLQNFELKLAQPADSVTYHSTLTLPIKDSLFICVTPRSK